MGLALAVLHLTVAPDAQQMTGGWHNTFTDSDEPITLTRVPPP